MEGTLNERDKRTRGVCILGTSELLAPISLDFHELTDELISLVVAAALSVEISFRSSDLSGRELRKI